MQRLVYLEQMGAICSISWFIYAAPLCIDLIISWKIWCGELLRRLQVPPVQLCRGWFSPDYEVVNVCCAARRRGGAGGTGEGEGGGGGGRWRKSPVSPVSPSSWLTRKRKNLFISFSLQNVREHFSFPLHSNLMIVSRRRVSQETSVNLLQTTLIKKTKKKQTGCCVFCSGGGLL